MIVERVMSWAGTVAAVYAIMLATYLASCLVVNALNRGLAAAKIQSRDTPPAPPRARTDG